MTDEKKVEQPATAKPVPHTGDTVKVHVKVREGEKERTQIFEGLVIGTHAGTGPSATFRVRRIGASNVGVERIFPLYAPSIQKIEITAPKKKVRRSKLYYIRKHRTVAL